MAEQNFCKHCKFWEGIPELPKREGWMMARCNKATVVHNTERQDYEGLAGRDVVITGPYFGCNLFEEEIGK